MLSALQAVVLEPFADSDGSNESYDGVECYPLECLYHDELVLKVRSLRLEGLPEMGRSDLVRVLR